MKRILFAAALVCAIATPVRADGLNPFQWNQYQMDQAQQNLQNYVNQRRAADDAEFYNQQALDAQQEANQIAREAQDRAFWSEILRRQRCAPDGHDC